MTYHAKVDGDVVIADEYNDNLQHGYWGAAIYDADVGGDDTYAVTLTPAPTAYTNGMTFRFKPTTANTGACTLNVNGLGVKDIVKNVSDALETGDIEAGQIILVVYNGTAFELFTRPNMATTSVKGVAAWSSDNFEVISGVGKVKDDGISAEEIDGLTGTGAVDTDNIPEGSTNRYVTTGGIATTDLNTSTGSASGSGNGAVNMNEYSFFPNVYSSVNADFNMESSSVSSTGTVGRFYMGSGTGSWSVLWRYVTSSDKDHWCYAVTDLENNIKKIWEAPDHCPVSDFNPFGELKEDEKLFIIKMDDILEDIKNERKSSKRSISSIIFDDYEIDKEKQWKERIIVERDEYDEKGGEKYLRDYDRVKSILTERFIEKYEKEPTESEIKLVMDAVVEKYNTNLKRLKVESLPEDIKFMTIKKKG